MKKRRKRETSDLAIPAGNVKILIISRGRTFSLWIEGAEKLLLCLSHSVRILLKKQVLALKGKGLVCMTYVGGAIEVSGILEEIRFEPSPSLGDENA